MIIIIFLSANFISTENILRKLLVSTAILSFFENLYIVDTHDT